MALQLGHRVSVDFDLFSPRRIKKNLASDLKKTFPNDRVKIVVNNREELTAFVDGVKITFLHYPFPILKKFADYHGLKLLSVAELAATKAYTIGRRGAFKDYADLFFVIKNRHSTLAQIIQLAQKKYSHNFNSRLFLEQLIYLEDIQDEKINLLKRLNLSKQQITKYFLREIKKMKIAE